MRATGDDLAVYPFCDVEPMSPEAFAAVGRLSAVSPVCLAPGTPLCAFCTGSPVDPDWRSLVGDIDGSLWGQLVLHDALSDSIDHQPDPFLRWFERS